MIRAVILAASHPLMESVYFIEQEPGRVVVYGHNKDNTFTYLSVNVTKRYKSPTKIL